MVESGLPGIWNKSFVNEGRIRIVDGQQRQADFGSEMIAVIAFKGESGARAERLSFVVFLVGIAAVMIFFFEQQPVFV